MWTRSELKEKGKTVFRATYWKCVLVALISAIVTGSLTSAASAGANVGSGDVSYNLIPSHDGFNGFRTTGVLWMLTAFVGVTVIVLLVGLALDICIFNPLEVGTKRFFVYNLNRPAELNELGFGFSGNYVNTIKIMFKKELYTFLWSLLFVIPGIVKAYEYRMIPYLLAENPNISEEEAFGRSRQMMDGQKWNVFVLDLSFIGWHILGVLTLGLVDVFWTQPYQEMTNAALYERFMYGTPAGGDGSGYYIGGYNNSGFGNNGCNNGGYGGNGFNNGGYGGNGYNSGSYGNNGGYGGNGYNNGGYSGNGYNNGGYSGSGFNNSGYSGNGYNNGGYNNGSYGNNTGYGGSGFNNGGNGFNNGGYGSNGYNNSGYNNGGYGSNSYNNDGYSNNGYENSDNNGGYHDDGHNSTGTDSTGTDTTGSQDNSGE